MYCSNRFIRLLIATGSTLYPMAAMAELPSTVVVPPTCGANFSGYGLDGAGDSSQSVKVNDPAVPFTEAVRVTNASAKAEIYSVAQVCSSVSAIAKDDVLVATYWLRNANANPAAQILRVEPDFQNDTSFQQYLVTNAPVDRAGWVKYAVPFRMKEGQALGAASFQFRFGSTAQSFEFGGISVKNYGQLGNVLPKELEDSFAFYYPGRGDPNVPWRTAAKARIEASRKAALNISVVGANNSAVKGAVVTVRQLSTPFNWATSAQPSDLVGGPRRTEGVTPQERQRYRSAIRANFNSASMQNELKWPDWEDDRVTPIRALKWFADNGLRTRGHNLVWPNDTPDFLLPTDVRDPATPPATVAKRALDHIAELAGRLKGQIPEWDVVNEPYSNTYLAGRIAFPPLITESSGRLGNKAIADWFKAARRADPDSKLFLNEFTIFERLEPLKRDYTRALVQSIQAQGGPVDGVGFQVHFAASAPVIADMDESVRLFDPLVKYFSATEFDSVTLDQKLQADVLEDVATYVFSQPKFLTFQIWGFWDGIQDDGNGPLFARDFTLKPAGQRWQSLTRQVWRTNVRGTTDAAGRYSTRAFLGKYRISVFACGKLTDFVRDLTGNTEVSLPIICAK